MATNAFEHQKYEGAAPSISTYTLAGLVVLVAACFFLDIAMGSVDIPFKEVLKILFAIKSDNNSWNYIVEQIRIPKAFTAVIAGCGLSVSGLQMQTLFRNPLAGPSVLGITAGANLGVALVMLSSGSIASLYTIRELGISGSWLLILASTLGAAFIMLIVVALSARIKDNVIMLIIGVMIANITVSVISIWQYFSAPEQIKDYLMWTFGSLGGVTQSHLYVLGTVVLVGLLISFASSKLLDALLLGENYAQSMGVTVKKARFLIIASTSLIAGGITAFCGPIGFLGVAVPHLTRSLFNSSDHRILIPGCCLIGTALMLLCDIIAQLPGSQSVLPINIITALVGSPVVIWVIVRNNNLRGF
jgi:iron complex transport system permease protein